VLEKIEEYFNLTESNGYFEHRRREQALYWMNETINEELKNKFYSNTLIQNKIAIIKESVLNGEIGPFAAATELINLYNTL
jgi:LAO/AO transport system kinase